MAMTDRALVLGGGGPVGIAWETGVLAGLADAGVAVTAMDFVLGTSAGSFVGAQITLGQPLEKMLEAQIALGRAESEGGGQGPKFDPSPFIAIAAKMPTDHEPSAALRQEFGALSAAAATMPIDAYLAIFSPLARHEPVFPAAFGCTAVDIDSGAFHIFRASDGAPLSHAVAASCSVPGIFPPPPILGRRWMDGGVRSSVSIDAAAGHRRVLTLAVITAMSGPIIAGQLARETAAVEAAGGQALVLAPNAESLGVFPSNLMNAKGRAAIAEAGFAQGRAEAARVGDFLS
jgi:NTE family protein